MFLEKTNSRLLAIIRSGTFKIVLINIYSRLTVFIFLFVYYKLFDQSLYLSVFLEFQFIQFLVSVIGSPLSILGLREKRSEGGIGLLENIIVLSAWSLVGSSVIVAFFLYFQHRAVWAEYALLTIVGTLTLVRSYLFSLSLLLDQAKTHLISFLVFILNLLLLVGIGRFAELTLLSAIALLYLGQFIELLAYLLLLFMKKVIVKQVAFREIRIQSSKINAAFYRVIVPGIISTSAQQLLFMLLMYRLSSIDKELSILIGWGNQLRSPMLMIINAIGVTILMNKNRYSAFNIVRVNTLVLFVNILLVPVVLFIIEAWTVISAVYLVAVMVQGAAMSISSLTGSILVASEDDWLAALHAFVPVLFCLTLILYSNFKLSPHGMICTYLIVSIVWSVLSLSIVRWHAMKQVI